MKKAIVLCSGGLDSVVTSYYAKKKFNYKDIFILFFDYKQKAYENEKKLSKKCAKNLKAKFIEIKVHELGKISNSLINKKGKIKKLKRKDLKDTKKESEKFYVPCRNSLFLVYSFAFAESLYLKEKKKFDIDIFVGFKNEGEESYPDTSERFVREIERLSKISCVKGFSIKAPLIKKDKEDIIKIGKKLGVDFKETHSCYIGNKKHCGSCLACKLRQEGFYWANVKDLTDYMK